MNPVMLRRYGAEFLGTFAYVFFGCGARILVGYGGDLSIRLVVYFTFGFTLFIMTYALGHISAAPFNPAVTFGLAVTRRFPWCYVLPYWLAQISGAFAASLVHLALFSKEAIANRFGSTIPNVGIVQAVAIEAIITFFLMLVSMSSTTDRRVNRAFVGLATGLMITVGGFFAAPLTGGSMNPARSLAPALLAGGTALTTVWIYWVGPLIGTTAGALVYEALRGGKEHAMEAPEGIFDNLNNKRAEKQKRS